MTCVPLLLRLNCCARPTPAGPAAAATTIKAVRLAGGVNSRQGYLQVQVGGRWYTGFCQTGEHTAALLLRALTAVQWYTLQQCNMVLQGPLGTP